MKRSSFLPGKAYVPPLPNFVVIEDRADGTLWYLSIVEDHGLPHVSINDASVHPMVPKHIYRAFDEPFISGDPRVRMIIRDGLIGMEVLTPPKGTSQQSSPPTHARKGFQREFIEIIIPKNVYWDPNVHTLYGLEQTVMDND